MRTAAPIRSSKPPGVLEAGAPHRQSQLGDDVEPAHPLRAECKSDVNEAMRIADLLAHSLSRSSFVPPAAIQELRNPRTSRQLVCEISQCSCGLPFWPKAGNRQKEEPRIS